MIPVGLILLLASAAQHDFLLVSPGTLGSVPIDEFEMMLHPVTNAEYKKFVDATGHAAPRHWEHGRIPAGMEQCPVIFVNRFDAEAYAVWRHRKERRFYRPHCCGIRIDAARANQPQAVYPWGGESPTSRASYDPTGERRLDQGRQYLNPVQSYPPNRWGLFDMAGNIWQMVDEVTDTSRGFPHRSLQRRR